MRFLLSCAVLAGCGFLMAPHVEGQLETGWKAHDLNRPAPAVVTSGATASDAPSDAIVLFDGSNLDQWRSGIDGEAKWKIVDQAMESVAGSGPLFTKEKFGDCQVHIEFASPAKVKGKGQGRGNSGVYLMGEFEVQVLDSFENSTYSDGSAGSIYGQHPPLVNASKKPGEWQSYDIIFHRPRFGADGKLLKRAQLTVLHNGVLIQDHRESFGPTNWILHKDYQSIKHKTEGSLGLQDHGNPVRYRNIWVRRLEKTPSQPTKKYDPVTIELDQESAQRLVGKYGNHEVKLEEGELYLRFHGNTALKLVPHSATEFGFSKSAGSLVFELDDDGKPTAIQLKLDAVGTRKEKRK